MLGIKFVINQDFQYGISVNEADVRLNSGSLILLEPAREGLTGIPTTLVNYASDLAEPLVGQAIPTITVRNTIADVGGVAERTAKGGIHGIYPQNLTEATPRGVLSGVLPQEIIDYCLAHPNNDLYMSLFGRITRNALANQTSYALAGVRTVSNPGTGTAVTPSLYQSTLNNNVAGGRNDPTNTLGRSISANPLNPWHIDIAQSVFQPQAASNINSVNYEIFTMGSHSDFTAIAGQPSWILYSLYLEDLTVSGQTYEQAHAKSQEVFNSRFSSGGIYANDTWTNPT